MKSLMPKRVPMILRSIFLGQVVLNRVKEKGKFLTSK